MSTVLEESEREIKSPSNDMALVSAVSKAELDQQITTARAFPRSITHFVKECRELACLNEQVASECYYVLPRSGKKIEGPSVRLAEIVQSAWGNSQAGARVIEEGAEFLTAQGVFYDLQRNVKVTMEVRRRITDKDGRRYNADMIGVTGNAACSIALRNAIFRGIPKAFWSDIYEAARKCAAGNIKSLVSNRTDALNWLARRGVTEKMVVEALGVNGIEDIGLDELGTLRGMCTALKDGEATVETVFAPKGTEAPRAKPKTEAPKAKDEAPPAAAAAPEATPTPEPPSAPSAPQDPPPAPPQSERERVMAKHRRQKADKPATVTVDQVTVLRDMLHEEGIEASRFCAEFEIGEIEQLEASRYEAAVAFIRAESEAQG